VATAARKSTLGEPTLPMLAIDRSRMGWPHQPWHRAQYDLKTGGVLTPPAPQGVASYKVVVEGDDVSIEL
jgi:hypothetical protein